MVGEGRIGKWMLGDGKGGDPMHLLLRLKNPVFDGLFYYERDRSGGEDMVGEGRIGKWMLGEGKGGDPMPLLLRLKKPVLDGLFY